MWHGELSRLWRCKRSTADVAHISANDNSLCVIPGMESQFSGV